jgi:hypothetical protein
MGDNYNDIQNGFKTTLQLQQNLTYKGDEIQLFIAENG